MKKILIIEDDPQIAPPSPFTSTDCAKKWKMIPPIQDISKR